MSGRAAIARPFDLLLGRKTCEIFAARWRLVGEDDPFGRTFSQVTKYVAAEIARLRQGDGPILLTQGSNVLLQTLLAHHLIDEFLPLPPCWSSDDQQARREQMKRES